MRDTDWRPSPCPVCGYWREAAEHPVCTNPNCNKKERTLKPAGYSKGEPLSDAQTVEPMRYVWVHYSNQAQNETYTVHLIDDPVEAWNGSSFDRERDRIYRLGEEVEVKISVEIKNKNSMFRGVRIDPWDT